MIVLVACATLYLPSQTLTVKPFSHWNQVPSPKTKTSSLLHQSILPNGNRFVKLYG